ncbi:MAG: GNAT family N-acetyltransferase [Planctomycetaceae bacterium]
MYEARPFAGTPEELAKFVVGAWESTYAGKMPVPHWSGDYFRWQLRLDEPDSHENSIAVYEGDQPVGVMLQFPVMFEIAGRPCPGVQSSWLSVVPEHRGRGVATLLFDAAQAALLKQNLRLRLGFGYTGSRVSLGPRFWKRQRDRSATSFVGRAGFWVRVLDARRAAAWNVNLPESRLTSLAGPFLRLSRPRNRSGIIIRPAQHSDVPRCLELADVATRNCQLRLVRDADALERHLGLAGFSQALVAEERGQVRGCIAYHCIPIAGRTVERVGILDLVFLSELSKAGRTELLKSVLWRLRDEGAVLALKLRTGDYPAGTFLSRGWFCKPADSDVIVNWAQESEKIPRLRRMHVLWR